MQATRTNHRGLLAEAEEPGEPEEEAAKLKRATHGKEERAVTALRLTRKGHDEMERVAGAMEGPICWGEASWQMLRRGRRSACPTQHARRP